MERPGISRAVPMGILGFMVGALVVILIRALQGLTPIWDPGVGLVFGTFFSAGFFVWGIGGFDPRMSAHGEEYAHEHAVAEAVDDEEHAPPTAILSHSMWQVVFATVLLIVVLGAAAGLGPTLITTADSDAAVHQVGMVPMELFGQELLVSQLVIFAVFLIVMFGSLALAAGAIGMLLNYLNRGVVEGRATAGASAALPPPAQAERQRQPRAMSMATFAILFIIVFTLLYLLFYYVLIGLIMPQPVELLTALSVVNALLFAILILRPRWVVQVIAAVADWLGRLLRARTRPYEGVRKSERRNRP